MKPLLKAVPYLRVSNGDLSRQKSLDDQLDEACQFASDEGVEIAEGLSYIDDGISGRSNAFSVLPGELAASIAVRAI
ncbi:MAG: recombinase family protein, partial [Elusimicrobiota bacterium]